MVPVTLVSSKGPVAVPTGLTASFLRVRLGGEDDQAGAGQAQRQCGVGLGGAHPYASVAGGLGGEVDAGQGGGHGLGARGAGEGRGDGLRA